MGFGRFIHLIGSVFLLVATALLVVSDISAPVVDQLAIVKVDLGNSNSKGDTINFGTFGYCVRGGDDGNRCSKSQIGYNPADVVFRLDGTDFSNAAEDTTKALTNVMVLHAVATGFAFIAFLLSLFSGIIGGFIATLAAVVTFIITVIALVCDFVSWSLIRHDVNKSSSDSSATFGPAIWCVLAAAVLTLLAAIIVFVTCCAGRRSSKRHTHSGSEPKDPHSGWTNNPPPHLERRKIWDPRGRW